MPPLADFGRPLRGRAFRAIWVSFLASAVGDWAARIALAILVLERTGSPAYSSLVVAVSFLPWLGPGQLMATRLGHLRRVPVMVAADLVRAAIYGVLLLRLPVAAILGLAFVAGLASPPFEAARSSLTVEVVPPDDYGPAIAMLDITEQGSTVLGYLVGGIWVLIGGYQLALAANVVSFLVSALALTRVRESRSRHERSGNSTTQLGRGLRIVWRDLVIRRAFLMLMVVALPVAAVEATAAAYARIVLHAGASTTGELAAALPLGIIVAIPFLPRSGGPARLLRAAGAVAALGGAVAAVAFGAGHLAGALVGFFGAGLLTGSVTPAQIAFQPRIPTEHRPGVFSVIQGTVMALQAVGAAIGGIVATLADPRAGALVWMLLVVALSLVSLALPLREAGDRGNQDAGAPVG